MTICCISPNTFYCLSISCLDTYGILNNKKFSPQKAGNDSPRGTNDRRGNAIMRWWEVTVEGAVLCDSALKLSHCYRTQGRHIFKVKAQGQTISEACEHMWTQKYLTILIIMSRREQGWHSWHNPLTVIRLLTRLLENFCLCWRKMSAYPGSKTMMERER